jgi:hypothetical protein
VVVSVFKTNFVAAAIAYLVFLLPIPMTLDIDVQPGERLARQALMTLASVLGVAVLLTALCGPLVATLLGIELP